MRFVCINNDGSPISVPETTILVEMACYMYQNKMSRVNSQFPSFQGIIQTEFKTVLLIDIHGIEFYGDYVFHGRKKWIRFIVHEEFLRHPQIDSPSCIGGACLTEEAAYSGIPEPSVN